eukprot:1048360_1
MASYSSDVPFASSSIVSIQLQIQQNAYIQPTAKEIRIKSVHIQWHAQASTHSYIDHGSSFHWIIPDVGGNYLDYTLQNKRLITSKHKKKASANDKEAQIKTPNTNAS